MDDASLPRTSWDLPPSPNRPSPHAHPTAPGCPWVSCPSSDPRYCLRHAMTGSAHPILASRRVGLTTLLRLLPPGFTFVWACGFASGTPDQNTWVRSPLSSTCFSRSVTTPTLVLATRLSVSSTVGLSPTGRLSSAAHHRTSLAKAGTCDARGSEQNDADSIARLFRDQVIRSTQGERSGRSTSFGYVYAGASDVL